MIKHLYFILLFILISFSCQAHIAKANSMEEMSHYLNQADTKTLIIFDVDMVLVQPSDPAFQMANMKRFSTISKRILNEVPADKRMIFLSLMTIHSDPILIDPFMPMLIQQLIDKKIPVMALTANLTGKLKTIECMEKWRAAGLRKLGIDFSKSAPYSSMLEFHELATYRDNVSVYLDGMLFVNGTAISKGEAFLAFLKRTMLAPEKVIFIDDREENLQSLETALQQFDQSIDYKGIYFLGAQKYPSKEISETEFETSWRSLSLEARELN